MARRGVMTALQAALAGIGGAAGGYVQQEELKRKRQIEDEERKQRQAALEAGLQAGIRSEQRDILKLGGTRIAGMGEQVAGPVPSAIPLSGVGNAFAAAEAAGGPATSRGALRQTVGESSFMLPGEGERTARERETTRAFAEEDFQTTNKRDFDTFKALGGRGEYRPNVIYSKMIADLGASKALAGQRSLIEARIGAAGAGAQAGAPKPGERGPLPTVVNTASQLDKMDVRDVLKLRPAGIAAATQAPLTLAETRGGFSGLLALPTVAAMNLYANAQEQDYAMMIRATADAVARASEKGVLTDRDIGRFQSQVMMLPGDNDDTIRTKFNNLKAWSKWLAGDNTNAPLPGESAEERQLRLAPMRADTTATGQTADAELQEDRRLWDQAVAKYGRARVEREYGPRP